MSFNDMRGYLSAIETDYSQYRGYQTVGANKLEYVDVEDEMAQDAVKRIKKQEGLQAVVFFAAFLFFGFVAYNAGIYKFGDNKVFITFVIGVISLMLLVSVATPLSVLLSRGKVAYATLIGKRVTRSRNKNNSVVFYVTVVQDSNKLIAENVRTTVKEYAAFNAGDKVLVVKLGFRCYCMNAK